MWICSQRDLQNSKKQSKQTKKKCFDASNTRSLLLATHTECVLFCFRCYFRWCVAVRVADRCGGIIFNVIQRFTSILLLMKRVILSKIAPVFSNDKNTIYAVHNHTKNYCTHPIRFEICFFFRFSFSFMCLAQLVAFTSG